MLSEDAYNDILNNVLKIRAIGPPPAQDSQPNEQQNIAAD